MFGVLKSAREWDVCYIFICGRAVSATRSIRARFTLQYAKPCARGRLCYRMNAHAFHGVGWPTVRNFSSLSALGLDLQMDDVHSASGEAVVR